MESPRVIGRHGRAASEGGTAEGGTAAGARSGARTPGAVGPSRGVPTRRDVPWRSMYQGLLWTLLLGQFVPLQLGLPWLSFALFGVLLLVIWIEQRLS